MNKAMESLLNAYVMCGGDPADLLKEITPALPALVGEEAEFFKPYEEDLNG
jgi:hypothetical protein